MFERKPNELPPFKYNVGDKIMGYHSSIGMHMLVGGEIVEREQSTSYLDNNKYKVKLEPELCGEDKNKGFTGWLNENEAQPFNQEIWNNAVRHWLKHGELNSKAYLEYVRMHRTLRGENDNISDEELERQLDQIHNKDKKVKEKVEKTEE